MEPGAPVLGRHGRAQAAILVFIAVHAAIYRDSLLPG